MPAAATPVQQVQLFGVGTKAISPAITAQRRINLYVETRREGEKTKFALVGRPGLVEFANTLAANPTRGMWAVNTLSQPLLFVVQAATVYAINNAGAVTAIGTLNTTIGDVSMVDDGTYLMIVDGDYGYYYNMVTAAGIVQITDGNFTTSPVYCTWQDTYFIVVSGATNQFQLSDNGTPITWPAVNINFSGASPGALRVGISDHSILNLFGEVYTEYWQNAGSPDFPFAAIPGSSQEFGLATAWSLAKFDNALVGLFKNRMGGINISRMSGFALKRLSDGDIEDAIATYGAQINDAKGFSVQWGGHPVYILNFLAAGQTWMYDGDTGIWSELQGYSENFRGAKFALFVNRLCIADRSTGAIYQFSTEAFEDAGDPLVREVWTRRIWNNNRYIGINWIQIDVESGTGTISGQGANPVLDLQVSKDGGNTFYSVGYSSIGEIGHYTQRVFWSSLGAARDWVLKLRITDPAKIVITNAVAQMVGGPF